MNPENELRWIAIDLDKTIAQNSPHPDYDLLEPIDGAWEALNELSHKGFNIAIHTARSWHDYDMIRDWLDRYDFNYDQIVCGKVFAKYYIDDRAIGFRGDWKETLKEIK